MSLEDNKSLALRYQQAWATNDHTEIDEFFSEAILVNYSPAPQPALGCEALKAMPDGIHHTFPDLTIENHQVVAERDAVALRWNMRGTHHDKRVSWSGQNMLRIINGKIVEDFGVDDSLAMLRQLGMTSIPGSEG